MPKRRFGTMMNTSAIGWGGEIRGRSSIREAARNRARLEQAVTKLQAVIRGRLSRMVLYLRHTRLGGISYFSFRLGSPSDWTEMDVPSWFSFWPGSR